MRHIPIGSQRPVNTSSISFYIEYIMLNVNEYAQYKQSQRNVSGPLRTAAIDGNSIGIHRKVKSIDQFFDSII